MKVPPEILQDWFASVHIELVEKRAEGLVFFIRWKGLECEFTAEQYLDTAEEMIQLYRRRPEIALVAMVNYTIREAKKRAPDNPSPQMELVTSLVQPLGELLQFWERSGEPEEEEKKE